MNSFRAKGPLTQPGKLVDMNEVMYKLTGKSTAVPGEKPTIGKTYFPPFNLSMANKAPLRLSSSGTKTAAAALPESFSWHNDDDVRKYKSDDLVGIILTPGNQLACGSCWAWATTTSLSDRVAIAEVGDNPKLGPSYLLSCSLGDDSCGADPGPNGEKPVQGCNGGQIAAALDDLSQDASGVPTSCWNYDWCAKDSQCSGGGADQSYNNGLIPSFSNADKCVSSSAKPLFYKVKKGSVKTLQDFDSIKLEIFNKGPVPTGYIVFNDFFLGTADKAKNPKADNWAKTGGIYVHLDTNEMGLTPAGDKISYDYADPGTLNSMAGAHAVVIVGWGVQEIDNPVPKAQPGAKLSLPFWWVRNSWGTTWNEGGFFRIAMSNPKLYINNKVQLDTAASQVGGVIAFEHEQGSAPKRKFKGSSGGDSKGSGLLDVKGSTFWLILLAVLIFGFLGYVLWKKRRGH